MARHPTGAYPMTGRTYRYGGQEWSRSEIDQQIREALRHIPSRVQATLDLIEGGYVLDAGCGNGVVASLVAQRGCRVLGIDHDPGAVAIATDWFSGPSTSFALGGLDSDALEEGSFDGALLLEVIEHLEDPSDALRRLRRLLKPGGWLILSTPNAISYYTILLNSVGNLARRVRTIETEPLGTGTEKDHIKIWDLMTLYRLAHRSGFRYVTHRYTGGGRPLPSRWRVGPELTWLSRVLGPLAMNIVLKLRALE